MLSEGSLTPHASQEQPKLGQCADHLLIGTRERLRFSLKIFSKGILKKGFGFGFRVAGSEIVLDCLSIVAGNREVHGIHWRGCLAVFRAGATPDSNKSDESYS